MPVQSDKAIKFFFPANGITVKNRKRLKYFLNNLLKREGKRLGFINFIFCSDKYLLNINQEYLDHNYYTDIITFDLSSRQGIIEAEIYISVDRVRENAANLGTTIRRETYRVMFHGLLHLCGYMDKTKVDKIKMRGREDFYLTKYIN